ncbi:MAG: hypothetical protein MRZ79_00015 [Bacteroidia bacterium]|nr:hypothetical protein [Bacteroidia bacterium]
MKLDFRIISFFLLVILVGALSWLVRWIYQTIKEKFKQDIELYKLRVDNVHMASTIRERGKVQEELYEAYMKAGRGEGLMQVVDRLMELAGQGGAEHYEELKKKLEEEMQLRQREFEHKLSKDNNVSRELEHMRVLRGDMQNELQRLRLMGRHKGVDKPSESRQQGVDKLSESRHNPVVNASETRNQQDDALSAPIEGGTREMYPVFKLLDVDSRYRMVSSEDLSRIHIINKRSNEELEVVAVGSIRKGKAYKVAQAVYLIWCELPGCNSLKITQSSNARACTREHMNQLTILDRQIQKHG